MSTAKVKNWSHIGLNKLVDSLNHNNLVHVDKLHTSGEQLLLDYGSLCECFEADIQNGMYRVEMNAVSDVKTAFENFNESDIDKKYGLYHLSISAKQDSWECRNDPTLFYDAMIVSKANADAVIREVFSQLMQVEGV